MKDSLAKIMANLLPVLITINLALTAWMSAQVIENAKGIAVLESDSHMAAIIEDVKETEKNVQRLLIEVAELKVITKKRGS